MKIDKPTISDGSDISGIDATKIASGTVPTARLGSGTASSSTYLRGDGTWATISAGSSDAYQAVSIASGDTSKTIDIGTNNIVDITASNTSSCTLAFSNVTQAKSGMIFITASGGARTIILPSSSPNCRVADNYGRTITVPSGETWVLGYTCISSTVISMFLAQTLTA